MLEPFRIRTSGPAEVVVKIVHVETRVEPAGDPDPGEG
jgi:hypothetical protein